MHHDIATHNEYMYYHITYHTETWYEHMQTMLEHDTMTYIISSYNPSYYVSYPESVHTLP